MIIDIKIRRIEPSEAGPGYADRPVPLLDMQTEFPEVASMNLRSVADLLDKGRPVEGRAALADVLNRLSDLEKGAGATVGDAIDIVCQVAAERGLD